MAKFPKLPKFPKKLPKLPKKLPKLPTVSDLTENPKTPIVSTLLRIRAFIKSVFSRIFAAIWSVLEPIKIKAGRQFDRLPGSAFARRFARRRLDNASARGRRLRQGLASTRDFMRSIPPPLQIPGWAIRGIWNGLKNPIIRWKAILLSAAAMIIIIFIAVIQFPLTTNPTFCGACHSMRPEMYTWRVSSHRRVTCYACHVKPGLFWLVRDHLVDGPLGMYKEWIDGYHDPMNSTSHLGLTKMPVMNCQRCHSPGNRRFTTTRGLKMNHEKHLKLGVRCTVCHNRITHPIRGYKNNLKMQACFRCHGAVKNAEFIEELEHLSHEKKEFGQYGDLAEAIKEDKPKPKCSLCHEPEWNLKPRSHLQANWAPTLSYETPTYLGASKREQWEYQSLKIALQPRPAKLNGIYQHARQAKMNPEYCYMCHSKEGLCSKCHKLDMPHVRPWWDRHGATVVANFKDSLGAMPSTINENTKKILCTRCHDTKNFCLDCHKKTVFPHATPWAPQHGKLAKKKGFEQVCTTCHSYQKFCLKCHNGVDMPHSRRWLGQHFAFLRDKSPKVCMRCHVPSQCEACHSRHGVHEMWTIMNPKEFIRPQKPQTVKRIPNE